MMIDKDIKIIYNNNRRDFKMTVDSLAVFLDRVKSGDGTGIRAGKAFHARFIMSPVYRDNL